MNNIFVLKACRSCGGKTEKLLSFYLNKIKSQQKHLKFKLTNIYDLRILPCDGCGLCKIERGCPKNGFDDFLKVVNLIKQSDYFVVATSVYFLGFPAQLKALIDRCEQFYSSKIKVGKFQNLKLNSGHLVLTAGGVTFECLSQLLKCCRQFFDCLDLEFKACLAAPRTDFDGLFFLINKFF